MQCGGAGEQGDERSVETSGGGAGEPGEDGGGEPVGLGLRVKAAPPVLHRQLQRRPPPEQQADALRHCRRPLLGQHHPAAGRAGGRGRGHGPLGRLCGREQIVLRENGNRENRAISLPFFYN